MRLPKDDIKLIMEKATLALYKKGEVELPGDGKVRTRHAFCFDPGDVVEIHTHKQGHGSGIWFRLKDGRVFDKRGGVAEYDPHLYDIQHE